MATQANLQAFVTELVLVGDLWTTWCQWPAEGRSSNSSAWGDRVGDRPSVVLNNKPWSTARRNCQVKSRNWFQKPRWGYMKHQWENIWQISQPLQQQQKQGVFPKQTKNNCNNKPQKGSPPKKHWGEKKCQQIRWASYLNIITYKEGGRRRQLLMCENRQHRIYFLQVKKIKKLNQHVKITDRMSLEKGSSAPKPCPPFCPVWTKSVCDWGPPLCVYPPFCPVWTKSVCNWGPPLCV